MKRVVSLLLYYGLARLLPGSEFPLGRHCRSFRVACIRGFLKSVGKGVELEERGVGTLALHRLLGHPEERRPRMELECQLASRGIDLSEGAGDVDPRAEQLEPGASEWRLLVQLSSDDEVGFYWGDGLGRLYVWIRERDLVERDTAAAWALLEQL